MPLSLNNEDYSFKNAVNCKIYLKHCAKAGDKNLSCCERFGHGVIATAEALPILGEIAALFELFIYRIAHCCDAPISPLDAHQVSIITSQARKKSVNTDPGNQSSTTTNGNPLPTTDTQQLPTNGNPLPTTIGTPPPITDTPQLPTNGNSFPIPPSTQCFSNHSPRLIPIIISTSSVAHSQDLGITFCDNDICSPHYQSIRVPGSSSNSPVSGSLSQQNSPLLSPLSLSRQGSCSLAEMDREENQNPSSSSPLSAHSSSASLPEHQEKEPSSPSRSHSSSPLSLPSDENGQSVTILQNLQLSNSTTVQSSTILSSSSSTQNHSSSSSNPPSLSPTEVASLAVSTFHMTTCASSFMVFSTTSSSTSSSSSSDNAIAPSSLALTKSTTNSSSESSPEQPSGIVSNTYTLVANGASTLYNGAATVTESVATSVVAVGTGVTNGAVALGNGAIAIKDGIVHTTTTAITVFREVRATLKEEANSPQVQSFAEEIYAPLQYLSPTKANLLLDFSADPARTVVTEGIKAIQTKPQALSSHRNETREALRTKFQQSYLPCHSPLALENHAEEEQAAALPSPNENPHVKTAQGVSSAVASVPVYADSVVRQGDQGYRAVALVQSTASKVVSTIAAPIKKGTKAVCRAVTNTITYAAITSEEAELEAALLIEALFRNVSTTAHNVAANGESHAQAPAALLAFFTDNASGKSFAEFAIQHCFPQLQARIASFIKDSNLEINRIFVSQTITQDLVGGVLGQATSISSAQFVSYFEQNHGETLSALKGLFDNKAGQIVKDGMGIGKTVIDETRKTLGLCHILNIFLSFDRIQKSLVDQSGNLSFGRLLMAQQESFDPNLKQAFSLVCHILGPQEKVEQPLLKVLAGTQLVMTSYRHRNVLENYALDFLPMDELLAYWKQPSGEYAQLATAVVSAAATAASNTGRVELDAPLHFLEEQGGKTKFGAIATQNRRAANAVAVTKTATKLAVATQQFQMANLWKAAGSLMSATAQAGQGFAVNEGAKRSEDVCKAAIQTLLGQLGADEMVATATAGLCSAIGAGMEVLTQGIPPRREPDLGEHKEAHLAVLN